MKKKDYKDYTDANISELIAQINYLEEEIKKDPLTRLYNRIHTECMVNEMLQNTPPQSFHVFLLLDLDDFKNVNAVFGHLGGDQVLKRFAAALQCTFEKNDIIGRLGGDEFVVFTAGTTPLEEIPSRIEAFVRRFHKTFCEYCPSTPPSFSVGITTVNQAHKNYSFNHLYISADKSLYEQKGMRQKNT